MDDVISLKFGIFNDFTIPFNVGSINSVFAINSHECICSTTRNMYKIERDEIKMSTSELIFSASLMIPDSDILVGVTNRTSRLFVYQTTNLSQPIISNFPINQLGIFHMYYSRKSSSLILVGYGIKVFYFKVDYKGNRHSVFPPDVTIKFRSKFCENFSPSLLTPVPFDSEHEYIFLPTKEGICPFDLDGNKKEPLSKFPATVTTVYFYNQFAHKIFTFDPNNGLIKWTQSGQIEQRFPSAGTSIVAMFLVDSENIVCYNSNKQIFLLNFLTGRTFYCYNLDKKPTRLFLIKLGNKPYLMVCQGATLIGLKIEIQWNVWCHPLLNCNKIIRCNQMNEAARIFVQTKDNIIDLYSPSKGNLISSATQKKAITPVSFFYDRGFHYYAKKNYSKYEFFNIQINPLENSFYKNNKDNNCSEKNTFENSKLNENHRDILYFVFEDGSIGGFFTGVSPCEEIININLKASFLCVVFYENVWCYATVSKRGILSLYDYVSFALITQTNIGYLDIIKIFYDFVNQSLIIINSKTSLIYDLKTKQIKCEIEITGSNIVSFFGDFVKFGYKSGHITTVFIENGSFNIHSIIDNRSHSTEITGFSFSQQFWISSSLDCHLIAWNYNEEQLFQIILPIPLTSCCILNGYRDILVSTDSEIMKIEGKKLFLKVDDEIPEIDNYDKICDYLELPHYFLIEQMMRKSKSKLSSSKKGKSITTEANKSTVSSNANSIDIKSLSNKSISKNSDNFNVKSTPKEKDHNRIDNDKIIQSMMEMNGLKSPIISQFKSNQATNANQSQDNRNENDKQTQKSIKENLNEDKKSNKNNSINKEFKKPVSAKEFLKNEMEKEKKFLSKPRKVKKKKNKFNKEEKQNLNETKPAKSAVDLLNQMSQNNLNQKEGQKSKITKKESTIDFTALAKQFEKIDEEKPKEYEYEYEYESESESESESEKKQKSKKVKNKKPIKEKIEKKEKVEKIEKVGKKEKTEKTNEKLESKKEDKTKSIRIDKKNPKSLIKNKNQTIVKKEKNKSHQKPKVKSKENNQNHSISQEIQHFQSRGIQGESVSDDNYDNNDYCSKSDGDEINSEEGFINKESEEDENSNYFTNSTDEINIKNENNNNEIQSINLTEEEESNSILSDNKFNVSNEEKNKEASNNVEEDNTNDNDNIFKENQANENQICNENEFEKQNENDTFALKNDQSQFISHNAKSVVDENKRIQYNPPAFQKAFKENKPVNFIDTKKESPYRPVGHFAFKLKKSEPINDCRPKRASTPEPLYDPHSKYSVKMKESKIHRSFSCRPKKQKQTVFEFDFDNIDEIPANILIDENALYEKYSIQRNLTEKATIPYKMNGIIYYDRTMKSSKKKNSIKPPKKSNSNFFKRKHQQNYELPDFEQNEVEIDQTVERLTLNQYQLHQFQKNFEYNMTYDEYNECEYYRNHPINHRKNNDDFIFKENKRQDAFDSKFQYFTKPSQRNEKDSTSTVKVYKIENSPKYEDKIRTKKKSSSSFLINNNVKDKIDDDNDDEILRIVPPIENEPKSPRKIKNSFRIKLKKNDVPYENAIFQNSGKNQEVDQLELAFLKRMPNFEMKNKRSSSSRRISKPKLYLNPVYPPNRNRGIESEFVQSSLDVH